MIIGTAGHVNHGKTTLVQALTGIATDRGPEAARRGMTLDLGFAHARGLSFIDMPGHAGFLPTMLAGAGGIDAALLAVSAAEGPRPQTHEHLACLALLGIPRLVVALTMADRAPPEALHAARAACESLLAGSFFAGAKVLAVAAPSGQGVEALHAALLALPTRKRDHEGAPRLAIDRVLAPRGAGLVVAGTLLSGTLAVGADAVLLPRGVVLRVRGLQVAGTAVEAAGPGARLAVQLAGRVPEGAAPTRGDWLGHPGIAAATRRLDARLTWLAGPPPTRALAVLAHHGAAQIAARLLPLGDGLARLLLDRAMPACAPDRLVLRDPSARTTLGGLVVLDPAPPARGATLPARRAWLAALDHEDAAAAARRALATPPHWLDAAAFATARNRGNAQALMRAAGGVRCGAFLLAPEAHAALREKILAALAAHHRAQPGQAGLAPPALAAALAPRPPPALLGALLAELRTEGLIALPGGVACLPGHAPTMPAREAALLARALKPLREGGAAPPRTRDLARALAVPEAVLRHALKAAARAGQLSEVAPDRFLPPEALAACARAVASVAARGALTPAALRDALGIGRKATLEILAHFDRLGVTRRQGEARALRPERLALLLPPDTETDAAPPP